MVKIPQFILERLDHGLLPFDTGNAKMTFKCNNKNDSFTKESSLGNHSLIHAIVILEKDESILSILYVNDKELKNNYLYTGTSWWLMSPDAFGSNGSAKVRAETQYGNSLFDVNSDSGVKPVINLKPNSLVSGDGTINNLYTVE